MKVHLEIRHYMIAFLSILALIGVFKYGFLAIFIHVLIVLSSAIVLDIILNYFKLKRLILSPSTIITGLIVAEIISFDLPVYTGIIASCLAVLSKHFIFYKEKHIFNPAAFGLVITSIIFDSATSWWGVTNIWLVMIFGLFIIYKLKRFELTLSYVLMHSILSLIIGFSAGSFFSYLNMMNVYFISFMLIEPITSPVKKKIRILYGSLVALISIGSFYLIPQIDHSLMGLLIANALFRYLNKVLK